MATGNGNLRRKGAASSRRVVVLAVPPVEEFDLVGPIQVFGAANRLAGKPIYAVEIATNGKDLKVQGEGGLLSFLADTNYNGLNENFDSLLLVCGLGTRNARDPELFAWLQRYAAWGQSASARFCLRKLACSMARERLPIGDSARNWPGAIPR